VANAGSSAWICQVCGYVHRGSQAPDACPVCGSPQSDFQPYVEQRPSTSSAPQQWQCIICSHMHDGSQPPASCPVCGATSSQFEPTSVQSDVHIPSGAVEKTVIVGAGIAGLSAAEAVRAAAPDTEIVLVSKEAELPYYRLNLTRYLAGEIGDDDLPIHPQAWYSEERIELLQGVDVSAVLAERQSIATDGGSRIGFDKLILTCGAHPFVPPIPGSDRPGVHVLRTVQDARALQQTVRPSMPCVCIGGGILGLETAAALARRGAQVTLLESFKWLLPRQLDHQGAEVLGSYVSGLGINVRLSATTAELLGDRRVRAVALADGSSLSANLVIIAAGVRPNSHLARRAGLEVNQGIVVDSYLATSCPNIYAAGDVAEHRGTLYGIWEPARYQGVIAGKNAAGAHIEFGGIPRANTLKVLGVNLFSVGEIEAKDGSYQVVARENDGNYMRFLFRDSHLVGAILIGDTRLAAASLRFAKERVDASRILARRPNVEDVIPICSQSELMVQYGHGGKQPWPNRRN